ncbi:MAG TPA: SRPBCC family protein [Oscillatoriaceae cyanobacterium]
MTEAQSATQSRELIATRVLNAPRSLVFQAFRDPQHLAQWWGPKGFTNTIHAYDFRPGGDWAITMHGPDGVDYRNENTFAELVESERLVIDHVSWPKFRLTITLSDQDGKTLVTWHQVFESVADFEKVKPFAAQGNVDNLERLAAVVASLQ